MKLIAVGDIHGRGFWKEVVEKEKDFDKFIFMGDYFDNFPPMTQREIQENFAQILAFKKMNPDRVVMLIGNHDYHYIFEGQKYSGYNAAGALNPTRS